MAVELCSVPICAHYSVCDGEIIACDYCYCQMDAYRIVQFISKMLGIEKADAELEDGTAVEESDRLWA